MENFNTVFFTYIYNFLRSKEFFRSGVHSPLNIPPPDYRLFGPWGSWHTYSHSNLFAFKLVHTLLTYLYQKSYAGVPCPLPLSPLSNPSPLHLEAGAHLNAGRLIDIATYSHSNVAYAGFLSLPEAQDGLLETPPRCHVTIY